MLASRRARRAIGVFTAALAALSFAACGVPVDGQPTALARHDIPFGLLEPSSPTTTPTTAPSVVEVPVEIFLVGPSGRLVPARRDVAVSAPDLATVLDALAAGPTDAEVAAGLQTALPAQIRVLGAFIASGVATVNLGNAFGQLVGQLQIQAVAQVVFTAASLPGVTGVSFELAGLPVEVPIASGAQVPVANPSQFASLAPVPGSS